MALEAAAGTSHHGHASYERGLSPAQYASVGYEPSTTSAALRARAASLSAAPHPSDSERRRTSSAREMRRCLGVGGRSLHVAPRARDEGERPLVGAGSFRSESADHDQSGTARARSKLERCPSSLVTTSAGAPAPCDTRRWLGAWRWKPRLARRRTGANRMKVASHWRGAVRQLMSRPQPACQGARVADSSAAPHPSESERRRTSAARETRRCLGVGGRSWHVAPQGHAEGKRPLNGTVRLCTTRDDDNNQRSTARAFRKLECYASSLVTASAGMHAPRHGT